MGYPGPHNRGMEATAAAVISWEPPHDITDPDRVQAIFDSMDSDPDEAVWQGPPLVADTACDRLLTGTHRQAAIHRMVTEYGLHTWAIPVVDIYDLVDPDEVDARCEAGETWDNVVMDLMAHHPRAAEVGWDRE